MKIRIRESRKISVVDIQGQIDINAAELIETIGWLLKSRKKDILLNLNQVDLVDYSGISILAIAYKNVLNHKGKMKFCNVSAHVEELFKLVRLDSIFEVYLDEATALTTFHYESPIDKKHLRRRFKRLFVHIEIEFRSKRAAKKTWYTGKLFNLSGNGIFLYTKKLLRVREELELRITMKDKRQIDVDGTVVWLADKKIQPQSYPGMGIYFKKMRKQDQDLLLNFINKHITRRSAPM
ncbi:MAG: anti-sigma factor antagonist [Candidatus Omnitrophica bacterium]|nr:anti-sigma factor antagonist [Candidatus Omnitrophota bacterium]